MMRRTRILTIVLAVVATLAACGPPPSGSTSRGADASPTVKKRLVASIFSDPPGMHIHLTQPNVGSAPGVAEMWQMMGAGLAYSDDQDVLQPLLAEAVPTAENGLWRVQPDGKMQTSWKIKPGVAWHDGTPVTGDDFVFTFQFHQDREVGIVNVAAIKLVERVEAPDPTTVVAHWTSPFIEADQLFTAALAMPIPKHILEPPYLADKANILNHSFWREGFIGPGAYKLKEWAVGSHLTLEANDRYVLGKPRIDEMEVRFVIDLNTIIAHMLSGTLQKPIGRGLILENALQIRDMSKDVNVLLGGQLGGVLPIFTQFVNTQPAIVGNVEFRRALLMSIDRQEMSDTLNYGLGPVAHSWLPPDRVEYPSVERRIVKYDYDPRRAAQMIESLGYTAGAGGVFRDVRGEPLALELRTTDQLAIQPKGSYSVAEYWKRLGVDVEVNNVPNQRIPDREYRSQYPAFELVRTGLGPGSGGISTYRSTNTPLPENGFQGANRTRYVNPAYDAMIDRYVSTIPMTERMAALGDIINHQTDLLIVMTLFFEPGVAVLGTSRVKNVTSSKVWSAHLWDVE